MNLTPNQLITVQSEIRCLTDEQAKYDAEWKGSKVRFVRAAQAAVRDHNTKVAAQSQSQIPQAEESAQPAEETARAAEEIQAAEEPVRAITTVAPEETAEPAEDFVAPDEIEIARKIGRAHV